MANLEKFYIPQYDKAGIYAVVNRTKMTAYVGQSTNIKKRALQHKTGIQNGTHNVKEINEDKEDEFTFLVLHKFYNEEVAKSKLDFYEKIYMFTLAKAGFKLYNKNDVGYYKNILDIAAYMCNDIAFELGTDENLKDAYFEKYGKHYCYDIKIANNRK